MKGRNKQMCIPWKNETRTKRPKNKSFKLEIRDLTENCKKRINNS